MGSLPTLIESNGNVLEIQRVTGPGLSAQGAPGLYVYPDNTYSIFTNRLSLFIFTVPQSNLVASNNARTLFVGQSTQVNYRGGSGSGLIQFNSKSPGICRVSSAGIVTGVMPGNCLINLSKAASTRFMSAISNTLLIKVSESSQSALQSKSARNWLIYLKNEEGYAVLINLAPGYANNKAELQLRTYVRGRLVYRTLGEVSLDERGDAVYQGQNSLLKGSRLRLVISGSNIKYGTTI